MHHPERRQPDEGGCRVRWERKENISQSCHLDEVRPQSRGGGCELWLKQAQAGINARRVGHE